MNNFKFVRHFISKINCNDISIFFSKFLYRLINKRQKQSIIFNKKFILSKCESFEDYAKSINPLLFLETQRWTYLFKDNASKAILNIPFKTGGGGLYPLLYFLVRFYKPKYIVETGVAAGYSSAAILEALHENKFGKLFSSDYPYPTKINSAKYIGILVDKKYRDRWSLHLEGDHKNLTKLPLEFQGGINLFHYDSSKHIQDKRKTFKTIYKYLCTGAIIIFDDIQDDLFFYELISTIQLKKYHIFKFKGKYLGLIHL